MEHLFRAWPEVAATLAQADHVLLLSDYDGTLTPIVEHPELAHLSTATRSLLQELAQQQRYTVGIISGRALRDLKLRVGVESMLYAGNHGLEVEGASVSFVHPVAEEFKAVAHELNLALQRGISTIKGAFVEDKGLSLSVHYRLADSEREPEVKSAFEHAVSEPRRLGKVRTTAGKKVYEVRPAVDWDKGKAIAMVVAETSRAQPESRTTAVFLGDDLTDEDGFMVVGKLGGITVFVGDEPRETAADYFLRSPSEVADFLSRLAEAEKQRA